MNELTTQDIVKKKNKRGNIENFKGIKSPGRPKGKGNLIGSTMKQDMLSVYKRLGSAEGLYKWCKRNPSNLSLFFRMMISLIPKNLHIDSHITHSLSKLSDQDLRDIIKRGEVLAARGDVDDIVDLVPDYNK
tara:strand:- start:97 stop:492 length:396 start_codon:yes stop_codon:yes gene_type:complete